MGLELEQKARTRPTSSEPVALEDLAAEVLKLAAIAERMERTLGREADNGEPPTGICACVAELRDTVGRAPNAAGGTIGLIELVVRILQAIGG